MSLALPLAFLAVVGLVGYLSYRAQQKRREALHQFATNRGWTWVARDDSWTERFVGDPFGEGDHRRAQNVLTGSYRGRGMVAFDYSFQTHSTDGRGNRTTSTRRYAVCSLALPGALPTLELVPEGLLGRLGTVLGMQDVELESEDFNRRYRVRCRDPKLAYDLLPPHTMEALLRRPALHLRVSGTDAVCWEGGAHSPVELLARLDALGALLDGVPAYVWSDARSGEGSA